MSEKGYFAERAIERSIREQVHPRFRWEDEPVLVVWLLVLAVIAGALGGYFAWRIFG